MSYSALWAQAEYCDPRTLVILGLSWWYSPPWILKPAYHKSHIPLPRGKLSNPGTGRGAGPTLEPRRISRARSFAAICQIFCANIPASEAGMLYRSANLSCRPKSEVAADHPQGCDWPGQLFTPVASVLRYPGIDVANEAEDNITTPPVITADLRLSSGSTIR